MNSCMANVNDYPCDLPPGHRGPHRARREIRRCCGTVDGSTHADGCDRELEDLQREQHERSLPPAEPILVNVRRAAGIAGTRVRDVLISIGGENGSLDGPLAESPGQMIALVNSFDADARSLAAALHESLPGGTLDRLIGRLLQIKASQFRVPYAQPETPPTARPFKSDQARIDRGEYDRAAGDAACAVCGLPLYDHPDVRGYEWLRRRCDGRLVKL